MELSLNKANKFLQKLNSHNPQFSSHHPISAVALRSVDTEIPQKNNDPLWALKAKLAEATDKKHKEAQAEFQIMDDTSALKEALFKANIESGVSALMRKKELVTTKLNKYKQMLKELSNSDSIVTNDEITVSFVKVAQESESRYDRYSVAVFHISELEEAISALNESINDIDDQILALNATTKIKIELSAPTKKLLGLR